MTPPDLWSFEGVWRLERRIEDRLAPGPARIGQAQGQAVLARDGDGLVYDERVTLHLPGQRPIEGTRRYLWTAVAGGIAVRFADGRAFHQITLGAGAPEAAHWCAPDQYDVRYDFTHWPRWTSRWDVRGPRKNYMMQTDYAPDGEA